MKLITKKLLKTVVNCSYFMNYLLTFKLHCNENGLLIIIKEYKFIALSISFKLR